MGRLLHDLHVYTTLLRVLFFIISILHLFCTQRRDVGTALPARVALPWGRAATVAVCALRGSRYRQAVVFGPAQPTQPCCPPLPGQLARRCVQMAPSYLDPDSTDGQVVPADDPATGTVRYGAYVAGIAQHTSLYNMLVLRAPRNEHVCA